MNLSEIKKTVNLRKYAYNFYGLVCNSSGLAKCPFHKPDKHPSFAINFDENIWKWYDPHDKSGGSIIDLEIKFRKCSKKKAIENLLKIFKDKEIPVNLKPSEESSEGKNYEYKGIAREITHYTYKDQDGKEILRKEKKVLMDGTKIYTWHHMKGDCWHFKMGDYEHIPYNLNQFENHKRIIIAEEEKDADTINNLKMGEFASSAPTGASDWPDCITRYFKGKEIVFLYDTGAEKYVEEHASELKKAYPDMHVFIATVPLEEKNADISDYLNQFKTVKEKQMALAEVLSKDKEFIPPPEIPMTVMASEVEAKEVSWLWKNYIPRDNLTLLSGDPGIGKSWFALDLACRVSRGASWADGSPGNMPANVYWVTIEDNRSTTTKPRIISLGGDPAKIALYVSEHPIHLDLSDEDGLKKLESEIIKVSNVLFLVIDPIIDFTGGLNPNAVEVVRSLLAPIQKMAERLRMAVLFTGHLNKAQTLSAIYRTGGTTSGWLGKCRAGFMIVKDPDDPGKRFFMPLKANLSYPDPEKMEFEIIDGKLDIRLLDRDIDLNYLLAPKKGRPPKARISAAEWLEGVFGDRIEVPSVEIEERCRLENPCSKRTLDRLKYESDSGYESARLPDGSWIWRKTS